MFCFVDMVVGMMREGLGKADGLSVLPGTQKCIDMASAASSYNLDTYVYWYYIPSSL